MRKILTILFLFFISFGYSQRFPSIDSAKRYTLKYIRNSTVESFTNLRMQNVSYGTLELLEDLVGNGYIDSLWIVDGGSNADTLRYRMGSTTYTAGLISGGGGGTWGSITGTLSSQSDLQAALNAKANTTLTLTINGTAYDLSANRSWTVGDLLSSGSYSNPAWITDLAYSKITGVPSFLQYYLINGATNLGSGSQVFKDTSSNKINLRSIVAGTGISVTQNANDITIASTIPANADSTAARIVRGTFAQRPAVPDTGQIFWQTDALEGRYEYDGYQWNFIGAPQNYLVNDQFTYSATQNGSGHTAFASGTGSGGNHTVYTDTISNIGSAGQWKLQTGTTSTGYTYIYNNNSAYGTSDSITFYNEQYIKIPVLSNGTDRFQVQVGINASSGYGGNSMVFKYQDDVNSGNWQTQTATPGGGAGNSTVKNTSVPVGTGWVKLGIKSINTRNNNTLQLFYINDVLVSTHSKLAGDKISETQAGSATAIYYSTSGIFKSIGTTNRIMLIDYSFTYKIRSK